MKKVKRDYVQGCLLVFLAGLLWGTVGLFVKELERAGSTPELTGLLRVFFAFVIMGIACCMKYGAGALWIDRKTLLVCALLGLICHGVYNIFYSMAVALVGVSISAVLLNIAPVFTLLVLRSFVWRTVYQDQDYRYCAQYYWVRINSYEWTA